MNEMPPNRAECLAHNREVLSDPEYWETAIKKQREAIDQLVALSEYEFQAALKMSGLLFTQLEEQITAKKCNCPTCAATMAALAMAFIGMVEIQKIRRATVKN